MANPATSETMPQVFFLVLEGVHLLDLAGPAHVFEAAREFGVSYQIHFCGLGKKPVASQLGLRLAGLESMAEAKPQAGDLVFIPGVHRIAQRRQQADRPGAWLRAAHHRGATLCSVCTGAFMLAWAGLLDGRRSTTHWSQVEALRAAAPRSQVQGEVLFIEDGNVYTSAGVSSGIDLALAVLESRHGAFLATRVARELVLYLRRPGDHAQGSVHLDYRNHLRVGVHRVQDWLATHPDRRATLPELARIAALSPRHLSRLFRQATGITIQQYRTRLRLERAHHLQSDPEMTRSAIAAACGFEDARQLRRIQRTALLAHQPKFP